MARISPFGAGNAGGREALDGAPRGVVVRARVQWRGLSRFLGGPMGARTRKRLAGPRFRSTQPRPRGPLTWRVERPYVKVVVKEAYLGMAVVHVGDLERVKRVTRHIQCRGGTCDWRSWILIGPVAIQAKPGWSACTTPLSHPFVCKHSVRMLCKSRSGNRSSRSCVCLREPGAPTPIPL